MGAAVASSLTPRQVFLACSYTAFPDVVGDGQDARIGRGHGQNDLLVKGVG